MKHKKGASEYSLTIISWMLFVIASLFFFLLFTISLKGCFKEKDANLQSIVSEVTNKAETDTLFINLARNRINFDANGDGTKETMNLADLIFEYCSKQKNTKMSGVLKTKIKMEFLSILFRGTQVARLECPDGTKDVLRDRVCKKPDLMSIPSPDGIIKIDYCPKPDKPGYDFPPTIKSPDGEIWELLEASFDKKTYWRKQGTETLLTQEEFENEYVFWEVSEAAAVREFSEKVKAANKGDIVTAPNKSEWQKKSGNLWCMLFDGEKTVSCESTMVTQEQLIAYEGDIPPGTMPEDLGEQNP